MLNYIWRLIRLLKKKKLTFHIYSKTPFQVVPFYMDDKKHWLVFYWDASLTQIILRLRKLSQIFDDPEDTVRFFERCKPYINYYDNCFVRVNWNGDVFRLIDAFQPSPRIDKRQLKRLLKGGQ